MENNNQITPAADQPVDETIFTADQFSLEGYDKHIRQARNAIFAAAGILLLSVIIMVGTAPAGYDYLMVDVAIWGAFIVAFVVLAFWTKKKPYTAIICALVLYIILIILNAIIDPTSIIKGIIFKIFVFGALFKGLKDAKEAQQMREQMGMK